MEATTPEVSKVNGDNSEPVEPELPDEEEESSEEEESDEEPIIPFLATREKRPNAGNRMRALLEVEDIEQEELFKEDEDDVEFEAKEEEDVFDSDFGSTDSGSGAEDEGEDAGEKQLQREAKAAKRAAMGKKAKKVRTPFLPSFARQTKQSSRRTTSNAVASTSALPDGTQPPPPKRKKPNETIFSIMPRESSRKSAVAFKKTIEERLQESEQRRASLPKPKQKAVVSLTQADLIMEALETEEVNRASLLAFYAAEEDRRAADRIAGMRYEIIGPKLTFLSRLEGVKRDRKGKGKEVVQDGGNVESEENRMESGRRRLIEVIGEAGKEGWKPEIDVQEAAAAVAAPLSAGGSEVVPATPANDGMDVDPTSSNQQMPETGNAEPSIGPPPAVESVPDPTTQIPSLATPAADEPTSVIETPVSTPAPSPLPSTSLVPSASSAPASSSTLAPPPSMPTPTSLDPGEAETDVEPHARNYLILDEFYGTKQQEMSALFGTHHQWGSVKVIPSRSRVLNRKTVNCPLTGLPAPYRDPRTMTPYANAAAYKTLQSVISKEYAWNSTVGAFTGSTLLGLGKEVEDAAPLRVAQKVKEKEKEKIVEKEKERVDKFENIYTKGYVGGSGGASARAARRESKGEVA